MRGWLDEHRGSVVTRDKSIHKKKKARLAPGQNRAIRLTRPRQRARKAEIVIPKRTRGRQSTAAQAAYQEQVGEFCRRIEEIRASLDFEVSARGWCYILEERGATKADFPTIERLFVACRKSGDLPIDICAEDEARAADHVEKLDDEAPK